MKKIRMEEEEKKWKESVTKEREEFFKVNNSKSENPKEKEKSG
jgi:hypothetical protein